ncbi:MAG: hypothetical protein RL367_2093, partial [Pseudomonadota bacterium]
MSVNRDFYLARVASCMTEADASNLDNVRDRCLRSAAAWQLMADRITQTEEARAQRDNSKLVMPPEASSFMLAES